MIQKSDFLKELGDLSPAEMRQVAEFAASLRSREQERRSRGAELRPIGEESCVGMWRDQTDMDDSTEWVRELRKREWS